MPDPSAIVISEYVRSRVRPLIQKYGDMTRVAREVGIVSQALSQFMSGKAQIGTKSESAFARLFADGSIDKLRADARVWWNEQPAATRDPGPRVEYDERYPNRKIAADWARAEGLASDEAIRSVQGQALQSSGDLKPSEWLDEMKYEDRRLRHERLGSPLKAADSAVPVETETLKQRSARILREREIRSDSKGSIPAKKPPK